MTDDEYEAWARRRGLPRPRKSNQHFDAEVLAEIVALLPSWLFIAGLIAIVIACFG